MTIKTNVLSLNAYRNLTNVSVGQTRASQRLSSGFRINSAADDAAGLSVSSKMRAQIRGIDQASRNAQDAISLIQTAEGGTASINDMIIRMRELVVFASNDTNVHDGGNLSQSDRAKIQHEIDRIIDEIDSISQRIQFNTKRLLSGNFALPFMAALDASIPSTATPAQEIQPQSAPVRPATPTIINATNVNEIGTGWTLSPDGLLTIYGGGDFQINGAGLTIDRIEVTSAIETNLILNNVNIDTASGAALDMQNATVNLWLEGNNVLDASRTSGSIRNAGIQTNGGFLTINGTGSLEANGGASAAGIGGGFNMDHFFDGGNGGNITINGGNIIATGLHGAAGIGGGAMGSAIINITGGNITANGGYFGAGIGSGVGSGVADTTLLLGSVTISGGIIVANGGYSGAGIGTGAGGSFGNIYINGGIITANSDSDGAGIGTGGTGGGDIDGAIGFISITGGRVVASSSSGAAIGGGYDNVVPTLTISGGLVQIADGQWIGGTGLRYGTGTTNVVGGNLSINPDNINSSLIHLYNNQPAFRVQITL
ncbi:MAG: hypothetical protein FWC91_11695, partial [Defluviitaleaceae bacterium]|nr:hypothetical protein [Defluviitaleaceae bacterium]